MVDPQAADSTSQSAPPALGATARSARFQPRGDATAATLAGWFLPGAGQMLLGEFALGALALLVVGGTYWLGLRLSAGMSFEFLDPELRSPFAPLLGPEAGNLGGFVWQLRQYGFGAGYPRPFPDTMRLGSVLCAVSGIANLVVMVHANVLARSGDARRAWRPALAVGATWLFPGLGHALQGRRKRAAIVCALLLALFVGGTLLAGASNLSRERHFYYWAGQFLIGLPALAAEVLFGRTAVQGHIAYADAGLVYACLAGLLNVLAMIDVYGWQEALLWGRDPRLHGRHPSDAPAAGNEGVRA